MTVYDGTDAYGASKGVSSARLNLTVLWHGAALPVGAANKVPQNGIFLLESTGELYRQDNAVVSTPTWTKLSSGGGQAGDQLYPLDTTIGNYTQPSAAVSTSSVPSATTTIDDDFTSYANQAAVDAVYIPTNTGGGGDMVLGNTITDLINAQALGSNSADNRSGVTRDLTSISDSAWVMRFKLVIVSSVNADANYNTVWIGLGSTTGLAGTNQDFIGMALHRTTTTGEIHTMESDGAIVNTVFDQTFATDLTAVTHYVEIIRTSTTAYTIELFSDSSFSTSVEKETGSVPSTVATLRYFKVMSGDQSGAGSVVCTIDDVQIYDGVTSAGDTDSSIDDSTTTSWKSDAEVNPAIYVDMASNKEVAGLAIHLDRTTTTETEIEIRVSTDVTFSAAETVRTLLVSDFTDDTWRFISLPRLADDRRYVQIYGSSGASVILKINEIKYLAVTDWDRDHYHKYLDPDSTSANSEDSD